MDFCTQSRQEVKGKIKKGGIFITFSFFFIFFIFSFYVRGERDSQKDCARFCGAAAEALVFFFF